MSHLFAFGLGYSAGVLSTRLAARGWHISGTRTTARGAETLRAAGYDGYVFAGRERDPAIAAALQRATHVLLSIPPEADGDPAFLSYGGDIALCPSVRWIGYLSTVGVYGDAAGGWVDEATPAVPASERGQRRLHAEQQWQALAMGSGKTAVVFRLPGIYGPGRSAIDDVRAGQARRIIKPGQVFNRIHVEDIAGAVEAALARPHVSGIFNVTDDLPAPPQDVVEYAAQLLSAPLPPALDFATADLSPMARSFYSESKRVANAKIKAELGLQLRYPTYREGLAAIARG